MIGGGGGERRERGGSIRDLHEFPLTLSPFPTALYLQPIESDQEVLMKYLMQIVPASGIDRKATPLLATPPTHRRNFSGSELSFWGILLSELLEHVARRRDEGEGFSKMCALVVRVPMSDRIPACACRNCA